MTEEITESALETASAFTTEELRETNDWDSMLRLIAEKLGPVQDVAKEIGDGYSALDTKDKQRLVGVPFICVSWTFNDSQQFKGREFVSVRIMTRDGAKIILNDGSTGIYKQLRDYTDTHDRQGGLMVHKGLRVSTYPYVDNNGVESTATTYYLDTSYSASGR